MRLFRNPIPLPEIPEKGASGAKMLHLKPPKWGPNGGQVMCQTPPNAGLPGRGVILRPSKPPFNAVLPGPAGLGTSDTMCKRRDASADTMSWPRVVHAERRVSAALSAILFPRKGSCCQTGDGHPTREHRVQSQFADCDTLGRCVGLKTCVYACDIDVLNTDEAAGGRA